MTSALANIARQLGGVVNGNQVLAPGPNHSKRDRSMSVALSLSAPDGFLVFSHCGDDPLACKDHVRRMLGWDRQTRRREPVSRTIKPKQQSFDLVEAAKIARANALWDEARHPAGTIVTTYLASRGLDLPDEVAGEAIRFHAACPWHDEASGRTIRVPAMIAAMRSIATEELTGVHRTRLTLDGRKVDRRMLGRVGDTAIMLTPMSAVGAGLALGEGLETTLAGIAMGWAPAWALGSVGAIQRFPVLAGLQSLIVFAETGDSGASARAVEIVRDRYLAAGREVIAIEPECAGDLNDVLRGAA